MGASASSAVRCEVILCVRDNKLDTSNRERNALLLVKLFACRVTYSTLAQGWLRWQKYLTRLLVRLAPSSRRSRRASDRLFVEMKVITSAIASFALCLFGRDQRARHGTRRRDPSFEPAEKRYPMILRPDQIQFHS